MVDVSCQVYLHFFCETNLLAIQENGDHEQIQMRLCYFKWPLEIKSEYNKPVKYVDFIAGAEHWH